MKAIFRKLDLFPTSGERSGGDAYSVGFLERVSGPNRVGVSPSFSPENENSYSGRNGVFSLILRIPNDG